MLTKRRSAMARARRIEWARLSAVVSIESRLDILADELHRLHEAETAAVARGMGIEFLERLDAMLARKWFSIVDELARTES